MGAAVLIPAEIGGITRNLVFKFGTMRLAEQELGKPITAELASGEVSLAVISALFWAALQPSLMMTREASDDLIDEAGLSVVAGWIGEGLRRYHGGGDAEPGGAESGGAEPAAGEPKAGKKGK